MAECPQCSRDFEECQCSTRLVPSQAPPGEEESFSAPLSEEKELRTATAIKGYKQIKLLGRGSSSAVFLAEQLTLAKRVAIKLLYQTLASDPRAIRRFELEARALSNLNHPNLAEVFDLGVADDGTPYIVMEYADGADLKSLIAANGSLEPERVIEIASQLCDALSYAHNNQIIHRDIKPTNVIMMRDWQGNELVKLVDFGIAKPTEQGGEMQRLTQTGELIGSPGYMSPEQIRGDEIDESADIYSLGCIMYEALTGRTPFRGESIMTTLTLHLEQQPEPLEKIKPDLAKWPELSSLVLKCLAKDKGARIPSAKILKDSLSQLIAPKQDVKKGHPGLVVFLVAIVILSVVNAAIFLSERQVPDKYSADSAQTDTLSAVDQVESKKAERLALNTVPSQSQESASNLACELTRSDIMYETGLQEKCIKNYETALDEAIGANAPGKTQLAIGALLAESYQVTDDPLPAMEALYKRLKGKIEAVSKSTSNDSDCLFAALILAKIEAQLASHANDLYDDPRTREQAIQIAEEAIKHLNEALILARRRQDIDAGGVIGRIFEAIGSAYAAEHMFYLARQNYKHSFDWLKKIDGADADETHKVVLALTKTSIALHKAQRLDRSSRGNDQTYMKTTKDALQSVIKARTEAEEDEEVIQELKDAMNELNAEMPS